VAIASGEQRSFERQSSDYRFGIPVHSADRGCSSWRPDDHVPGFWSARRAEPLGVDGHAAGAVRRIPGTAGPPSRFDVHLTL